jgi:uncharacterized protein
MASDSLWHAGDADRGSAVPFEVAMENGMEAKAEKALSQIPSGKDMGVQTSPPGMASTFRPGPSQQVQVATVGVGYSQPVKTYVLYHANCPDGFGAAFAAWLKFGDQAEYIPCSYGQLPPEMEQGSRAFILDFSYPRNVLKAMGRCFCNQIIILDHHANAKADLEDMPGSHFDLNKSGAVMAWEYFFPEKEVPQFFLYLQDRDLWRWKMPFSREVSLALASYPFDFNDWLIHWSHVPELKAVGKIIRRLVDQQVEIMARNFRRAWFDLARGRVSFVEPGTAPMVETNQAVAPACNAPVFMSEVGEKLLELCPAAIFSAVYFDRGDSKRQWSLRSRPEFDCSVIARAFGGGGHKQASGFIM